MTKDPAEHHAADPDDLQNETPEGAGASTGLDRPTPKAGPVADTSIPAVDQTDLGLEDRPQG
jgi:hypothetical protein